MTTSMRQRLEDQSESLRQEKEKLAQLELDAHRRADALLAQTREEAGLCLSEAHRRAEELLNAASAQASDTVAQAQARREELLREAEEQTLSKSPKNHHIIKYHYHFKTVRLL